MLTSQQVRGGIVLLFASALLIWFLWHTIKKAEDPAEMAFRWLITAVVIAFMIWKVFPQFDQGGMAAMYGLTLGLVCGFVLLVTWRRTIAAIVSKPFENLYTGGDIAPEPVPAYSVAQARQKQGRYLEAIAEIRAQLDRFPTDVEGHMLLAQIQAEDLQDLAGAELTIRRFCEQPGHAPQNIVFALYSLADWHLAIAQDREAARRDLEKIIELLPDSEFSLGAAQRIAHIGTAEMVLSPHERKKYFVPEGVQRLGLVKDYKPFKPAETDPAQLALEYVKHLEQYPLDTEVRENLAAIYTDHYKRLDLATDQLEEMIQQPNQPAKLVVRWLNMLADLQIRSGADYESVRQTLQRIVDRDPKAPAADLARQRIALLKLELKAKEKSQAVKLGSYEQNIGLKRGSPNREL